jgi:GAF domain-containing protein
VIQVVVWLTTLVNVGGLAVSLWLGLYLVTRPPRSRLSWLAALTLWSVSGFYLHNALLIHLPGSDVLAWLRVAPMLAMASGFHLLLLLPLDMEPPGREFFLPPLRLPWLHVHFPNITRLAVPLVYGLALLLLLLGVFPLGLPPQGSLRPVVYLSDRTATPLYPLVPGYLLLLVTLSLLHLWQCRKQETTPKRRRQYIPLFGFVILTGLSGLYLALGVRLQLAIPSFPADLALGAAAVILGYRVAQNQARMQGVAIERDLLYMGLAIGSLTICYVVLAEILHLGGHMFSTVTLIMIVIVAVSSLMLYDALRSSLDRLFYREHFRQLRANLRALSRESGIGQGLPERLQAVLTRLCATLDVRQGLVAMRDGETFVCQATERAQPVGEAFPEGALAGGEIAALPLPGTTGPEGMALLIPIHADGEQVAAVALGGKESGAPFIEEDLILLDDLADDLGRIIHTMRLQEKNARALSQMVSDFREQEHALQRQVQGMLVEGQTAQGDTSEEEFVSSVEDALRRLYDYPYLGEHALAQLAVVHWCLAERQPGFETHIDRGKALSEVLVQAMEKLRPDKPEPKPLMVPSREWHLFLVLYAAYVVGDPNRDIMSRLYIGEGTFNRTRRRALRGVARALREMEREASQRTTE